MAVPVIENSTVHSQQTNDSSFSHTGTGSDLLAVVLIGQRYGASGGIVGVTYGGNTMTLGKTTPSGLGKVYYLTSAPSGAQTVAVDVLAASVGRGYRVAALTITGADLTDVIDSTAETSGKSDPTIRATITTTETDILVVSAMVATGGADPTIFGTGHTDISNGVLESGIGIYGFGHVSAATTGAYELGWNATGQNNDFGMAVAGIRPVGASSFIPQIIIM